MDLDCSSPQMNVNEVDASEQQQLHNNSREIRVVGNKIYDSASGKTCHQCRQKTRDLAASCTNLKNGKPCAIRVCRRCLLNRYGEKAEEVDMSNWTCPKCKGICNCSCCMKKRGQQPTGALAHRAKASGFKSVSEMLSVRASGSLELNNVNDAAVLPTKEAIGDGDNGGAVSQTVIAESLAVGKCAANFVTEKVEEEIPLPYGTAITEIFDIKFPTQDVGNALQFLEFCRVFGKALDVKKGEAEEFLRELVHNQNLGSGQNTSVVQFQNRLCTLILTDSKTMSQSRTTTNGNDSCWLKDLEDIITESDLVLKEFPTKWLKEGGSGYDDLEWSKKLHLLNFLCDEALGTGELRGYINDQNVKFVKETKEAKSKVAAAKEKERILKQKLQDETAMKKSNEDNLSNAEQDALLSTIKSEAAKAHTEMLEAMGTVPKRKQSCDAMRTGSEFLDCRGQTFWKLKSYNGEYAVLLQDFKIQDVDGTAVDERWFVYGPEQKDEIDEYISSRAKRSKIRKVSL